MNLWREHPILSAAVAVLVVGVAALLWRLRARLMRSEHERRRAAEELNRRLSELFSLQELSYVLSDSLELDRIVEQVVRYAVRFLDAQGALLARSTGREHLELVRNSGPEPTAIVGDVQAASAAAVPLRSQGAVIGTLVIADPREGVFVPEDIRLLSTLATHAAVVIANARFFEMVRRAKEQWET